MAGCKAVCAAAPCAPPPILRALPSRRSCSSPATAAAAYPALTPVSTCAVPNSCALAATAARPPRFPPPSGWDVVAESGLDLATPPALPADTAAASSNPSPARCRTSHTTPSSYANRAPVPSQTALAHPSHCSLSRASRLSTRPSLLQCQECPRSNLSAMSPVCTHRLARSVRAGKKRCTSSHFLSRGLFARAFVTSEHP